MTINRDILSGPTWASGRRLVHDQATGRTRPWKAHVHQSFPLEVMCSSIVDEAVLTAPANSGKTELLFSSALYLAACGLKVVYVIPYLPMADFVRETQLRPLFDLHGIEFDITGATDVEDGYDAVLYDDLHSIPPSWPLKRGRLKTVYAGISRTRPAPIAVPAYESSTAFALSEFDKRWHRLQRRAGGAVVMSHDVDFEQAANRRQMSPGG